MDSKSVDEKLSEPWVQRRDRSVLAYADRFVPDARVRSLPETVTIYQVSTAEGSPGT